MCPPIAALPALMFVTSAISGVVGYMGQQAQYEAAQDQYEANRDAANAAATNRYASQQNRIIQEERAASQQKQQVAIEAAEARATARTAASEAGVSGLSVDALLQDISAQEGRFESSVDENFAMTKSFLRGEMKATQDQAVARINSVPVPTKPSFASSLVNIFSSGINAYAKGISLNG